MTSNQVLERLHAVPSGEPWGNRTEMVSKTIASLGIRSSCRGCAEAAGQAKEGVTMRRVSILVSLLIVVLAGSLLFSRITPESGAQEATPDSGPIRVTELAPGIAIELFAAVPSARAPGQMVYLARLTFQPGAEIIPHSHPGTSVIGVASGSFGWTLLEGSAQVIRGAAAGATGPAEMVTEPGTEVILEPGDAIVYEDDVVHTARGAGDEETVILVTQVLTAGEPRLMPADMAMGATPAP